MLQPKRTKYRKTQKGRNEGLAYAGSIVSFGEFGLKATSRGQITAREIEAARRAFTREMKREGKVWIRVFPDKPITQKALGVRMGKGKGAPEGWVAPVKRGKIMFEVAGVPEDVAREALRLASHKLPVKTKIVKREEMGGESNEG